MIALDSLMRVRATTSLQAFSGFVVSGADAGSFLQGQLTNDARSLAISRHQRTGYCTPKGRLLAVMLQWRVADDTFAHLLPADLHPATVKRLRMYVLRAKASFSPADVPLQAQGIWGDTLEPSEPGQVVSLNGNDGPWLLVDTPCPVMGPRAWLVGKPDQLAAISGRGPDLPQWDPMIWAMGDILCGKAWVWPATVEAFVPQMINLELVDGVSFTKGCYPGQEVVARSQYLGKLKRRTFRVQFEGTDLPSLALPEAVAGTTPWRADSLAGLDVWCESMASEPCGRVVAAAPRFDPQGQTISGTSLLAECTLDAWAAGGLHLGTMDGPALTAADLPYSFPAAA